MRERGAAPLVAVVLAVGVAACIAPRKQPLAIDPGYAEEPLAWSTDFEGDLDRYLTIVGGGSIHPDEKRAHGGTRSMRIESGAGWKERAFLRLDDSRLFGASELWVRAFLYMDAPAADGVHWNHFQARGPARKDDVYGGKRFTAQLAHGGMHGGKYLQNYDTPGGYDGTGPKSDCWRNSRHAMPTGRWVCLEWHIHPQEALVESYEDGELVPDQTVRNVSDGCVAHGTDDRWVFPSTIDEIEIGWAEFGDHARPHRLWVDDVAVGAVRQPCSASTSAAATLTRPPATHASSSGRWANASATRW